MNKRSHAPHAAQPTEGPLDRTLVAAFLENVPDAVYFKDAHGRFIAVSHSKAQRHGLAPEDLIGTTDRDYFSDEHAAAAETDEAAIMASGTPVIGKLEKTRWRDGRGGWAEVTKLPLRDVDGSVIGTFGITRDITRTEELKADLERTQREVVEASRTAGMADVAAGVLHNVGNVLTSLNVSANVLATTLQRSKAVSLAKLADMLDAHAADVGDFLAHDPKGQRVPDFLSSLARHAAEERDLLLQEVAALQEHIDHIKEIVGMQQAYATTVGTPQSLDPAALIEDALRVKAMALARHDVTVIRDFTPTAAVVAERPKVLQILVHLIRHAKLALQAAPPAQKILRVSTAPGPKGTVRLIVQDNGNGFPAEELRTLFTPGFTTRSDGPGFGLHSSAQVAEALRGHLSASSEGVGRGTTFTLELPAAGDPLTCGTV